LHQFAGAALVFPVFPQFPTHCAFYSLATSHLEPLLRLSAKSFRADPSTIGAASIAHVERLGDLPRRLLERYRILVLYDTGEELTAETKSLFSAELAFRRRRELWEKADRPQGAFPARVCAAISQSPKLEPRRKCDSTLHSFKSQHSLALSHPVPPTAYTAACA
jgi:hypothetical protein